MKVKQIIWRINGILALIGGFFLKLVSFINFTEGLIFILVSWVLLNQLTEYVFYEVKE